jgi:hypothetical protein
MPVMNYVVSSRRLFGFTEGQEVSGEELAAAGLDAEHLAASGHLAAIGYTETKKHKGARKDATDSDKD